MFKAFSNWWNRDKIAQAAEQARVNAVLTAMQDELQNLKQSKQTVEQELTEAKSQLDVRRQQDKADEERRNGKDPWVEIKSAEFNDVKGIQIELDWNDAFVGYLRDNGIAAREDDAVVQKWLLMLYKDLIDRLEHQVVEKSDQTFINDFE